MALWLKTLDCRLQKNKTMGRPPTLPAQLRDGFYIDVRSKTADKGVKIRADSEEEMMANANIYKNSKEVTILGQLKKGVWLNDTSKADKKAKQAKEKAEKQKAAAAAKEPAPVKKAAAKAVKPAKAAKPAKAVAKKKK